MLERTMPIMGAEPGDPVSPPNMNRIDDLTR